VLIPTQGGVSRYQPSIAITAMCRCLIRFKESDFAQPSDRSIVMSMSVAEGTVEITNRFGLHVRTATIVAKTALRFLSNITLSLGKTHVSARSVTDMTMLGAGAGTSLKVSVEGPDAQDALKAIKKLFDDKFGED
jgi:phosphocarrier protein HPr